MLVRRAFYRWLIPAAFVLPLWLLVGWGVFSGGGLAFVWVVFVGAPSVLVGELLLTLLVRARGTVRAERAVSWWDVAGFGLWHALTIAVGFYNPVFFAAALVLAILVGLGLFWLSARQLWNEARPAVVLRRAADGLLYVPAPAPGPAAASEPFERPVAGGDVIVVEESRRPSA